MYRVTFIILNTVLDTSVTLVMYLSPQIFKTVLKLEYLKIAPSDF